MSASGALAGTRHPFPGGAPLCRVLPAALRSPSAPTGTSPGPPAPLQPWSGASSVCPTGDPSVVSVTICLLSDNNRGISMFVGFGVCVCLSLCSDLLLGSRHPDAEVVETPSFLVLVLGG